jgi:predicted CoA-binding protein
MTTTPTITGSPAQAQAAPSPCAAPPRPAGASAPAEAAKALRRYVYCLVDWDSPVDLGAMELPGNPDIFAVVHENIAAVVSATSAEKLEISRGNAIAHQRVMEAVMQRGHTVLPVKFNTIAEDKGGKSAEKRIVDHVLVGRNKEIVGLLSTMRPVVELGVKGLWTDMDSLFRHIVGGNQEIQSLRKKLLAPAGPGAARRPVNMTGQIRLGELVKKALEARKSEMEAALLQRLAPLAKDSRKNKTFGDPMFANLAILVDKSRQNDVLAVLTAFEAEQAGRAKLRCVGPLPPCNFLELVITWDD